VRTISAPVEGGPRVGLGAGDRPGEARTGPTGADSSALSAVGGAGRTYRPVSVDPPWAWAARPALSRRGPAASSHPEPRRDHSHTYHDEQLGTAGRIAELPIVGTPRHGVASGPSTGLARHACVGASTARGFHVKHHHDHVGWRSLAPLDGCPPTRDNAARTLVAATAEPHRS